MIITKPNSKRLPEELRERIESSVVNTYDEVIVIGTSELREGHLYEGGMRLDMQLVLRFTSDDKCELHYMDLEVAEQLASSITGMCNQIRRRIDEAANLKSDEEVK